jgi:hypothetical protein
MTLGSLWQDPDSQTWHRWTERWLVYFHRDGSTEISSLNSLQLRILSLIKVPPSIYTLPFPAPT